MHGLVVVSEGETVAYKFVFQFVAGGVVGQPRFAFELRAQAFAHARAVGFGQRCVDRLAGDALALQRRAYFVFAPAAQPQFLAHESPRIAGVVDEAFAD